VKSVRDFKYYRSLKITLHALYGIFVVIAFVPTALSQASQAALASQAHSRNSARADIRTIPALFISDIHFDPFHDPAKAQELVAAPVTQWRSILSAPPSSNQQQTFADLQRSCNARGVDTPYILLDSSLQAMRSRQPDAKFMTVSGDLIAHAFSCRYTTLVLNSAPGDYEAFVLKTLSFVVDELRSSFPGIPIYIALGNNDTSCGDYQLDAGSSFLAQAGQIITEGLTPSQQQQALKDFGEYGNFSITMSGPMHGTEFISFNDLFLSSRYSTCAGKHDFIAARRELFWLEQVLADARRRGQKVWFMGHIPPGIDPYTTIAKLKNICGEQAPVKFLSSDKLSDLLVEYADVVRLGIFAHTHMDEMRLLNSESKGLQSTADHRVAIKMVPSISPVNGNNPSFIVARVNPSSAMLQNYKVIAASNQTGIDATWSVEYDYAQTYHETEFSPSAVKELIEEFKTDRSAKTAVSEAYIRNYFAGDLSSALTPFWPQYVCALEDHTAKEYSACVCIGAR
jgi:sphingomyelin phosphodiesterase acid-like 3